MKEHKFAGSFIKIKEDSVAISWMLELGSSTTQNTI